MSREDSKVILETALRIVHRHLAMHRVSHPVPCNDNERNAA